MITLRPVLVRPGILDSPRVCALSVACQLFFRNLLHACDGAGRFVADPDELRAALYRLATRVSSPHVKAWMIECHQAGIVKLYTREATGYGEVKAYGQLDTKRRVLYPGPADEPELFTTDPPGPIQNTHANFPRAELNRRELKDPPNPPQPGGGKGEKLPSQTDSSDPLFLVLCQIEGSDPSQLTTRGRRRITRALAAIREVKPDVDQHDLSRAAQAWFELFPRARILTASALSLHWAKLVKVTARMKPPTLEAEPLGWRDWINENTPDTPYARGGEKEGFQWGDLADYYRAYLIEKVTRKTS